MNRSFLFFLLTLGLASCSTLSSSEPGDVKPILSALEGKPPLLLSEDNQYLAPNQLVSLLRSQSDSVQGFIDQRGVPDAVRAVDASSTEGKVEFFFLSPDELYRIEQQESVWVILGPEQIQREYVLPLRRAVRQRMSKAEQEQVGNDSSIPSETEESFFEESPASTTSASVDTKTEAPTASQGKNGSKEAQVRDLARLGGTKKANISSRGDLIHRVISSQETFAHIALWYSLDEKNASRIARINSSTEKGSLNPGDSITVPSYLLRNKVPLEAGTLSKLDVLMREE